MDFYNVYGFYKLFKRLKWFLRRFKKYILFIIIIILIALIFNTQYSFAYTDITPDGEYTKDLKGCFNYAKDYMEINGYEQPVYYLVVDNSLSRNQVYIYFATSDTFFYGESFGDFSITTKNTLKFRFDNFEFINISDANYNTNDGTTDGYIPQSTNYVLYSNTVIKPLSGSGSDLTPSVLPDVSIDYSVETPIITNTTEVLSTGNFDYVAINSKGFIGQNWKDFYLLTYDFSTNSEDITSVYARQEILITENSKYYTQDYDTSHMYMVPSSDLGLNFKNGNRYALKLATLEHKDGYDYYDYLFEIEFTVDGLTDAQQNNNNLNNIDSSIDDLNDNLTNSDININIQDSLPDDNTTDITTSGFDSIFNTIYNAFTVQNSKPLEINVPYVNKKFIISADTVYQGLNLGIFEELFSLVWYFIVSLFIVKDISKKINQIKSGNFENIQTNNVKEDLL